MLKFNIQLVSAAEQADPDHTWSQTPKKTEFSRRGPVLTINPNFKYKLLKTCTVVFDIMREFGLD